MLEEQHQPVKRTRLRGEERRALILRCAKQVFARSSYVEASTSELARESGVTEPMLYKHFGSKKGLFLAVLSECGAQFRNALQERISRRAEDDLFDALVHVVDDYSATYKADPETQRILFQAVIETKDPDIARCVSMSNQIVYEMIRELVERARGEGYLDPTISLDAATWGFMSAILALQYNLMLDLPYKVYNFLDEMGNIWFRGLRSHDS